MVAATNFVTYARIFHHVNIYLLYTKSKIARSLGNTENICMLKVNNRNTRKRCELCSKLTEKTFQNNLIDAVLVPLLLI